MNDTPPVPQPQKAPHDLGGEDAGDIDAIDHGMTFWQRQANALRAVAIGNKVIKLDELRRAAEDLGDDYARLSYFEITTTALRNLLFEKSVLGKRELTAKMVEIRARFDVPDEGNQPPNHSHDDHSHHDHGLQPDDDEGPPGDFEILSRAMQEHLQDQGRINADQIRRKIEQFDDDYPNRGGRVVARAWTDPAFKARLLENGNDAVAELGISMEADELIAVENTPEIHNLIVCTLCSCYPRSLLGMPPTWYKSRNYRSRVVHEPRSVLAEFGTEIAGDVTIRVHDSNADMRYVVLPMRPEGTEDWTEEQLEKLLSRDHLVGVTTPMLDDA